MSAQEIFRFGEFTLDVAERRLRSSGRIIRLSPKAFDVLVALVRRAPRLVTKPELLAHVWPESFVEEGILTVHMSALRKALRDDARPVTYIETVAGSGYRFVASVARDAAADEHVGPAVLARPVELYELVGTGRSHLLSGSYAELPGAVAAFRAAVDIDPTYAPAHAGLARGQCALAILRATPHQEAFAEAKTSALRALAMDPASADAQVALGMVLCFSEWDWAGAERSLRRALDINPDHTEALVQLGSLQDALGKLDEGLRLKQQALARDPRAALVLVQIAMSYWHQRRYDEARDWAGRALEIDPTHLLAGELVAGVHLMLGDVSRFLAENLRRAADFGVPDEAMSALKRVAERMDEAYATAGLPGVHRFMADQMMREPLDGDAAPKMAAQRAVSCGAAHRFDEAFEHLDLAMTVRDPILVHLAVAPQWDPLRRDRRFGQRLRVMGLPQSVRCG